MREPWTLTLHTCESISDIDDGDDWTLNGPDGQPLLIEGEHDAKTATAIYMLCQEIQRLNALITK